MSTHIAPSNSALVEAVHGAVNPKAKRRSLHSDGAPKWLAWSATCTLFGLLFAFPIMWTLLTSVKPSAEASAAPPTFFPTAFSVENYSKLGSYGIGIQYYILNSVQVALLTVVFTSIVAVLAGYGLSRYRFKGSNWVFMAILAAMMVPFPTMMISMFSVLQGIGLYNSLLGLALVYTTYQLPFSVFVMYNAFDALPAELQEAAVLDGASSWQILVRVMLPVVFPGIVTVMLFAFLASWNEFFAALILLSDSDKFTLPLVLMNAQTGNFGTVDWGAQQAGVAIAIVPVIVVFLFLQRYYVQGLVSGAVKA